MAMAEILTLTQYMRQNPGHAVRMACPLVDTSVRSTRCQLKGQAIEAMSLFFLLVGTLEICA